MLENNYENDIECINFFLSLKNKYQTQRQPWESKWDSAIAIFTNDVDKINTLYEGNSKLHIPIFHWKALGIYSRIARVIFRNYPFFRIDDLKNDAGNRSIIDFWNKYITDYQLHNIDFITNFKDGILMKVIYGTSVAKVTQEYETEKISYLDDEEPEEVTIKDDTYYRPILLEEFYSDVAKENIQESQACIHSTVVTWSELYNNRKRTELVQKEEQDPSGNTYIVEERQEKGFYINLDLLKLDGNNITEEQEEYMNYLNLGQSNGDAIKKDYIASLKAVKKTGYVRLDECYGKYWIDDKLQECIVTIAEGRILIRLQPTPDRKSVV